KNVPPEKISVVMNGLDRDVFSPREPDPEIIEKYDLQDRFVCSYIGTIGMACGLEVVIEAAKLLKEQGDRCVVFLLVGDGASREALEAQASENGLDNVRFAGRRPKSEMPAFLSASDACLVHLRKTGLFQTVMPSKIFEAAGMRRPIVNGVEGFAAGVIEKAGAGINIPPEDPRALIEALKRLRDAPEQALAFARAGEKYVLEHFDREKLAEKYLHIIQEQIQQRKAKK
ncbi:MAG: glycosyltransferase family 4 protein, partial [Candidatus Sumerlaeota bacterium]